MSAISPLRTFFEQELVESSESSARLPDDLAISTEHIVSHLVEQTVGRAALDAATHRPTSEDPAASVSWKDCLMVAALTELRPVRLLARN